MQSDGTWSSFLDSTNWLCCPLCLGRRQISYKRPANRPASFAFKPTSLFPPLCSTPSVLFHLLAHQNHCDGRQTVRLWGDTAEHTRFARDKRNKDVLFYSGGNYSIYNYQTWLHTMNTEDKAKGRLSGMAVEEGPKKKKKNYSSVIWKWVSPLLSYIIHV